jgi:2-amino-4-hydroxy-6-hydroxymethyldihydropteridine diphosphokinase
MHYKDVYLSLGSNVGSKRENIKKALRLLDNDKNIEVAHTSSLYETKPWGYIDQPNFYNCVSQINTNYEPIELLCLIKSIETKMGKIKSKKWGPRIIDIDIILFENIILNNDDLIIPHPWMEKRAFVLFPLMELNNEIMHPISKRGIAEFAEAVGERELKKIGRVV